MDFVRLGVLIGFFFREIWVKFEGEKEGIGGESLRKEDKGKYEIVLRVEEQIYKWEVGGLPGCAENL